MNDQAAVTQPAENLPVIAGERLPYYPGIEERFAVGRSQWRALVEAVFPAAQSTESIILALSYCKARKLDPFKRVVHIVPIWDKSQGKLVDTVWPGIGELRTTAMRTGAYAGKDKTVFGPEIKNEWAGVSVTYPAWAQATVYRMVQGQRVAFQGPEIYWSEAFASDKNGAPNSMWQKRTRGQLDKCAEAAALRAAFPEELGDEFTDAEAGAILQHDDGMQREDKIRDITPDTRRPTRGPKAPAPLADEEAAKTEPEMARGLAGAVSGDRSENNGGDPSSGGSDTQRGLTEIQFTEELQKCETVLAIDALVATNADYLASVSGGEKVRVDQAVVLRNKSLAHPPHHSADRPHK